MKEYSEIVKDFGEVFCGVKRVDYVNIRNTSKECQCILVIPVNAESIVHDRLRISPKKAQVEPGKSLRITLTYLSPLENLFDKMKYYIYENGTEVSSLSVLARTLGPSFSSKIYNIKFFRLCNVNKTVRHMKLENIMQCEAKFHFDIDKDYDRIQISQRHGVIPAKSKIYLKIIFNPTKPGMYYKTIFCLMQYHPPLILNVSGVYKPRLKIEPKDLSVRYPLEIRPDCNYAAYMERLKFEYALEEKIPFSLKCTTDRSCLRGIADAETEEEICMSPEEYSQLHLNKSNENPIQVVLTTYYVDMKNQKELLKGTTLINLSKCHYYYYEWDQDPNSDFWISPERGLVEPTMKTNFNVYFSPSEPDSLCHTEIDLRVFPCDPDPGPPDNSVVNLPLTLAIKIIGSSFPEDICGWMAQCSVVPKSLQLPFCVPNENVYGTFMINRRGHLPVSFKVVQSNETNYLIQPPLGYLSGDYQLFVIEFSGRPREGIYAEDIKIFFNNSKSMYETIKVATTVEIPTLIFGDNNSHTFAPVFPGARISETITIRNPTYLKLSYEFQNSEEITWYEVVNPQGTIEANCSSEVTIIYKPDFPCKYSGKLLCSVSSVSKMDYMILHTFELRGSCEYGFLVATPSVYDFGESTYLEQKTVKINLFNFSPVVINFKLMAVAKSFPPGDPDQDVVITPDRGTVLGRCSTVVEVAITPHDKEIFRYAILSQNLVDDSKNSKTLDDPRVVFSFSFEGVIASMQIVDLTIENSTHLFSPFWMWKMLNVNRLNKGLNSLEREFVVDGKFPEAALNSPPIVINLLLQANKHGNFHCEIRKKVICPCLEASDQILNSCIHSDFTEVYPEEINLNANERREFKMTCLFGTLSECTFEYVLDLPYRRSITLRAYFTALPEYDEFAFASVYLFPAVNLKPVFIGDTSPPLQLFWIYNNNSKPAAYSIKGLTLIKENANVQRIFECINPKGTIPAFSSLPLAFFFRPKELKKYTIRISLKLHARKTVILNLQGKGVLRLNQNILLAPEKTLPKKHILSVPDVDLMCTTNYISIDSQRKFSKSKRIFFVKNNSTTQTWSFRWHSFKADNIMLAYIQPSSGKIEPGQTMPMTLTFESLSYETSTSFSIPCDVINYTRLRAYEEAIRLQELMTEKTKDYFTITEKGKSYETPVVEIPEKPPVQHIHIGIRVNIFDNASLDLKLIPQQQCRLKADNEMETGFSTDVILKTLELPCVLQAFEKTLWNIINRGEFWRKINCRKNSSDFKYLQLLPECTRKRKPEADFARLQMSYIQSFFENQLKDVISTRFN